MTGEARRPPLPGSATRAALAGAAAGAGLAALARPLGRRLVEHRVERRCNVLTGARPRWISPRAHELHRSLLVADLHADSLLYGRDLVRRSSVGHVDVPRLIEGNVALGAFAACVRVPRHLNPERNEDTSDDVALLAVALGWPPATWRSGLARALHLAARARRFVDRSAGRLTLVTSRAELTAYLERRRSEPALTAGLLTIEGAAALDGSVDHVDRLADGGFRVFGLAHMVDNSFAGSSSGVGKGGLTALGSELVRRLEARGVLVDVAHASPATIDDVLAIARRPVIASHGGLRSVRDTVRNLSDEHVRGIAATGGLVGIGFWPAVLDGNDAAAIARSVARAISVAGIDHVGLGSDFDGAVPTPFDAAGMAQLTDALLAEGLGDAAVAAVMGGNVLALLGRTLPG